MKFEYIYLDWNVVKGLKDDKNPSFTITINSLKSKYKIPFAFAHLCDLQKNSIGNEDKVNNDLKFFEKLSDGYMLGTADDEYVIREQNIFEMFDKVKAAKYMLYPNYEIPETKLEEVKAVGLKTFFKDKNNIPLFPAVMFTAFKRFDADPELYKQLRELFKGKTDIKEVKFFNDLQNENITEAELMGVVDEYLNGQNPRKNEKMGTAYLLLDLVPGYRDTLRKKNSFSNIYTDRDHMLNGSFAKYYITNDVSSTKKIKFIYKMFGVETQVYNVKEFVDLFNIGNK